MAIHPSPPKIVQTAYYVADAEAAAHHWAQCLGAGPFFLLPNIELAEVTVWGQPSTFDHTSAYGWQGNLMVELVQQNCDTPSIYNNRPWGLHHLAHFVEDLPAALQAYEQRGMPTAMHASTSTGTEFAFVDANERHGHYIELYEETQALRGFYQMVQEAAADWDGQQPLRKF